MEDDDEKVTATTAKDVKEEHEEEMEEVDGDDDDEEEEEEEGSSLSLAAVLTTTASSSSSSAAHNDDSTTTSKKEALALLKTTETSSSAATQQQQHHQPKCKKCGKKARKGCTQSVCVKCCTDFTGCQVHIEQRSQSVFRDQIKNANTEIQKQAKEERSKCLLLGSRKNFFKEKGFQYMGDTIIIWNIHEFLSNQKWKDDALRKSNRRNSRRKLVRKVIRNSKRRFRRIIQELHNSNK